MRIIFILTLACTVFANPVGLKGFVRHTCDNEFVFFPDHPALSFGMSTDRIERALTAFEGTLLAHVKAFCGDSITEAEVKQLSILQFQNGFSILAEGDEDKNQELRALWDKCDWSSLSIAAGIPKEVYEFREDLMSIVSFPESCSKTSWDDDGTCALKLKFGDDISIKMTLRKCSDKILPYFNIECEGEDCKTFGKICQADSDCGTLTCDKDVIGLQGADVDEALIGVLYGIGFSKCNPEEKICKSVWPTVKKVFNRLFDMVGWTGDDTITKSSTLGVCSIEDPRAIIIKEETFNYGDCTDIDEGDRECSDKAGFKESLKLSAPTGADSDTADSVCFSNRGQLAEMMIELQKPDCGCFTGTYADWCQWCETNDQTLFQNIWDDENEEHVSVDCAKSTYTVSEFRKESIVAATASEEEPVINLGGEFPSLGEATIMFGIDCDGGVSFLPKSSLLAFNGNLPFVKAGKRMITALSEYILEERGLRKSDYMSFFVPGMRMLANAVKGTEYEVASPYKILEMETLFENVTFSNWPDTCNVNSMLEGRCTFDVNLDNFFANEGLTATLTDFIEDCPYPGFPHGFLACTGSLCDLAQNPLSLGKDGASGCSDNDDCPEHYECNTDLKIDGIARDLLFKSKDCKMNCDELPNWHAHKESCEVTPEDGCPNGSVCRPGYDNVNGMGNQWSVSCGYPILEPEGNLDSTQYTSMLDCWNACEGDLACTGCLLVCPLDCYQSGETNFQNIIDNSTTSDSLCSIPGDCGFQRMLADNCSQHAPISWRSGWPDLSQVEYPDTDDESKREVPVIKKERYSSDGKCSAPSAIDSVLERPDNLVLNILRALYDKEIVSDAANDVAKPGVCIVASFDSLLDDDENSNIISIEENEDGKTVVKFGTEAKTTEQAFLPDPVPEPEEEEQDAVKIDTQITLTDTNAPSDDDLQAIADQYKADLLTSLSSDISGATVVAKASVSDGVKELSHSFEYASVPSGEIVSSGETKFCELKPEGSTATCTSVVSDKVVTYKMTFTSSPPLENKIDQQAISSGFISASTADGISVESEGTPTVSRVIVVETEISGLTDVEATKQKIAETEDTVAADFGQSEAVTKANGDQAVDSSSVSSDSRAATSPTSPTEAPTKAPTLAPGTTAQPTLAPGAEIMDFSSASKQSIGLSLAMLCFAVLY